MGNVEIKQSYKTWLLNKVFIECWTTALCAKVLGRDPQTVEQDLESFLKDDNDAEGKRS